MKKNKVINLIPKILFVISVIIFLLYYGLPYIIGNLFISINGTLYEISPLLSSLIYWILFLLLFTIEIILYKIVNYFFISTKYSNKKILFSCCLSFFLLCIPCIYGSTLWNWILNYKYFFVNTLFVIIFILFLLAILSILFHFSKK